MGCSTSEADCEVHYVGNVVAAVAVDEDHPIQADVAETFRAIDPVDKPGLKAHVSWNGSELAGEMMRAGQSTLSDGRNVHHIYRHERDEPDHAVYDPDFVPEHCRPATWAGRTRSNGTGCFTELVKPRDWLFHRPDRTTVARAVTPTGTSGTMPQVVMCAHSGTVRLPLDVT